MKRLRGLVGKCLLLIASLMICEALARLLFPLPEVIHFNRVDFTPPGVFGGVDELSKEGVGDVDLEEFSYKARGPIRNLRVQWISDPDGVEVDHSLNLYGFRGDEFALRKQPGSERVLFIGDSFVEGLGVRDDETIPRHFERLAAERKVEALNLGVGGIALAEYARIASVAVPLLAPDHVVVVLFANDFPDPETAEAYYQAKDLLPPTPTPRLPRILTLITASLAGFQPTPFYHRGPFPFFLPVPHRSNPLSIMTPPEGIDPGLLEAARQGRLNPLIPSTVAELEERLLTPLGDQNGGRRPLAWLKRVVEERGAKLIVVYIPSHVTVADHYLELWREFGTEFRHESFTGPAFRQQQRNLYGLSSELGIRFVDMTPAVVEEERRGRRLYLGYDGHMNSDGYRLVAEKLLPVFERLTPSDSGRQRQVPVPR